jgi:glyoxylase I family protein
MATLGLNHIGVTVTDVEKSTAFYRDVVGMDVFLRSQMEGEWFDTLTFNKGAVIDIAYLKLGEFMLQLIEYKAGGGDTFPLAHHHVGNPHLCINVDDVDKKHEEAIAHGGLNPTPIVNVAGSAIRSFYVHDPDGLPVEFLQMADTGMAPAK